MFAVNLDIKKNLGDRKYMKLAELYPGDQEPPPFDPNIMNKLSLKYSLQFK